MPCSCNAYKTAFFKKLLLLSLFLVAELLKAKFFALCAVSLQSLA
jgi:hypothetical protein